MTESDAGTTQPAGQGLSDEEFAEQVASQTASDLEVEPLFEREHDGVATDTPIADAAADELDSA